MNRKDFLSLSTKAAVFLGLSTAISCKNETIEKTDNLEIADLDFHIMPPAGASVKWGVTAVTIATIIILA